jgi:hypothetical protein
MVATACHERTALWNLSEATIWAHDPRIGVLCQRVASDESIERKRPRTRIAPIFSVRDLSVSREHYERLGFKTRQYDQGYGFATFGRVEIHLAVVSNAESMSPCSAYLYVEDADELALTWMSAGADVSAPEDTAWGQHEGVVIDPDGNRIRFGSLMREFEE